MEGPASRGSSNSALAILHVEDCRIQRHLISRLAAALDADITLQTAGNLADALVLCAEGSFDAVLLDLMLPDSSGVETLRRLHDALPRVPIIVLTATDDRALALELLARGAQDYLLKNQVDGSSLLRSIRYAIERQRTALQLEQETARLRESEARLSWLFEHSPVPLIELDIGPGLSFLSVTAEGISAAAAQAFLAAIRLAAANRAALGLVGADSMADLTCVGDLVPAASLPAFGRALAQLGRGDTPAEHEALIRRLDGDDRSVRLGYALTADPGARGIRVMVSAMDLTAARKAELQIRLQAVALEATSYAVVITDVEGCILWVNPAFTDLTGYAREEAIGANPRILKSGTHDPAFYRSMWQDLRAGRLWEGEVVNRRKDGSFYSEHMTITPVRADGGEITHYIAIKFDISERKALEAKLMQSQKLESIGQLAAGVAHEINTPIQFIGDNLRFVKDAFAELLPPLAKLAHDAHIAAAARQDAEAPLGDLDLNYFRDEVPRAIADSLEGVEHVAKIVRSMKAFAHPGVNEMTSVDINGIVENAVTISRNEWKYIAELELQLAANLPPVPCLPGELGQVLLNMIVNATHAIETALGKDPPVKGSITISTLLRESSIEIRIADSGCGIPPEHRAKVFDLFFTTKDVGKGSGQGLAIAYSVVTEQHGGSLSFESEAGQGNDLHRQVCPWSARRQVWRRIR